MEPPCRLVANHITPQAACSGACTGRTSCTTCTCQGVDREYGRCTACVRRAGRIALADLQLSKQNTHHVHYRAVRESSAEYLRICQCDCHDTRHSARSTCRQPSADEKVGCTARPPAGDSERCLKRPSKGCFAAEKASVPSNLIEEP